MAELPSKVLLQEFTKSVIPSVRVKATVDLVNWALTETILSNNRAYFAIGS